MIKELKDANLKKKNHQIYLTIAIAIVFLIIGSKLNNNYSINFIVPEIVLKTNLQVIKIKTC